MGQQDIYEFLKKNGFGRFTSREISEGIGISIGSVATALKRMRECGRVSFCLEIVERSGYMGELYVYWLEEEK